MDTLDGLQKELAAHKRRYLSGPSTPARDDLFCIEENAIADRFLKIGEQPSYPSGFLESLRAEGIDPDDIIPF
ncbi:hypothetical protein CN154_15160 [Sinorhizobium meliloti]|uniref:hypothetical protein n=1 Tax=Rhizobium meliloti TaxID=382 RepID=UPI000FD91A10|nr:hypothetical protein [Sinorhizobium meliloti]RVK75440.1 hypothetical protein CN154_15160 [Sinorhizobium meliloti]